MSLLISIIGSGRVGSAIAFLAAATSLDDIQLVNRSKDKAIGQALDISNAIPKESSFSVTSTDFSGIKNSEVVVISASTGTYVTSRTEMISEQIIMIKDIAKKVKRFAPNSKILIVSNPVDVLNYIFLKETEISRNRVIGVASSLDSSRFRYLLSQELNVNASEIKNALVLGEHGDSMVPIFSVTKCNNKPVLDILSSSQLDKITKDVRNYWQVLRKFKGPSIFGIAKNTVDVLGTIIKNEELSIPASVMLDGEYGLSDVCLGVPVKITKDGLTEIQEITLNRYEKNSLCQSAATVRKYLLTEMSQIT